MLRKIMGNECTFIAKKISELPGNEGMACYFLYRNAVALNVIVNHCETMAICNKDAALYN